jgi:hypothetical protein
MTCAVCQKSRKGANRLGGLDVCDVCFNGGAAEAVEHRGWVLQTKSWVHPSRDGTNFHCESIGKMPNSTGLKATFRMKTGVWWFLGMFTGIKVEDPLFNKLVMAKSDTGPKTRAFLASEGAQSAIMDLVGDYARIEVRGNRISCHAVAKEIPSETRIEAETAVLMAHLETFAVVGGSGDSA